MKKKVNITLDDVLTSLELGSEGNYQYLNTETGVIVMISELEDSWDENGEPLDEEGRDNLEDEKYIEMPIVDSREAFRDMEDFTETVKNSRLRGMLEDALSKKRPFSNFKNVLHNSGIQNQFYDFQSARNRKRAQEWLESNNLEAVGKKEN